MITVCLLPKSQSNHVLQVENAAEEVCLLSLNDKKNSLQFSSVRKVFLLSPSPLICEPPANSWSKKGTLTYGHGGLPRT